MIPVKVIDLIGKAKVLENLDVPPKFSIYTRRLFKNYTLEIK
jgi:hypothetical protein